MHETTFPYNLVIAAAQQRAQCWLFCISEPETLFPTAFFNLLALWQGTVVSMCLTAYKGTVLLQGTALLQTISSTSQAVGFILWLKLSALCLTVSFTGLQQSYAPGL